MQGLITYANGSVSSLYGCIGYTVQDMIIREFGKDFFKYTTMASELATRNVRRVLGANSSREIAKRVKPELIIQPTFAVMDENGPLQGIPLTSNWHNLQYRTEHNYLLEAIRDSKNGYSLKFRMNRDRIDYDVTINLDTLDQQINVYKMMQNKFVWGITQAYEVALESVIPKRIIGTISKISHMDLDESLDYIPILLKRLNQCSGYPITYKIRNASATDEWFLYYTHRVYFTFQDLTAESGIKKGMSEDRYPITFRVSAEFNLPGVYFVEAIRKFSEELEVVISVASKYGAEEDTYFPIFTIPNLTKKFPPEIGGMQLYGSSIFKTNEPEDKEHPLIRDEIDLKGVLDNDHIRVIRTHTAWNMNPNTLLKVFLLKNSETQTYGKDYEVDYNRLSLIVKNPDEKATYRIAIYFNYATVNEILNNEKYNEMYDVPKVKEKEFPEGIKDGVYMKVNETPVMVPSKKLVPDHDIKSKLPEMITVHPDAPNPVFIDPRLVLQKDKILLKTEGPYYQESAEIKPGNVHLEVDELEDDQGMSIHNAHIAIGEEEQPLDQIPWHDMTPADIHNAPILDPEILHEKIVKEQAEIAIKEKSKSKKKYSSSV